MYLYICFLNIAYKGFNFGLIILEALLSSVNMEPNGVIF